MSIGRPPYRLPAEIPRRGVRIRSRSHPRGRFQFPAPIRSPGDPCSEVPSPTDPGPDYWFPWPTNDSEEPFPTHSLPTRLGGPRVGGPGRKPSAREVWEGPHRPGVPPATDSAASCKRRRHPARWCRNSKVPDRAMLVRPAVWFPRSYCGQSARHQHVRSPLWLARAARAAWQDGAGWGGSSMSARLPFLVQTCA
jgi:hypothetical protein